MTQKTPKIVKNIVLSLDVPSLYLKDVNIYYIMSERVYKNLEEDNLPPQNKKVLLINKTFVVYITLTITTRGGGLAAESLWLNKALKYGIPDDK